MQEAGKGGGEIVVVRLNLRYRVSGSKDGWRKRLTPQSDA